MLRLSLVCDTQFCGNSIELSNCSILTTATSQKGTQTLKAHAEAQKWTFLGKEAFCFTCSKKIGEQL